MKKGKKIIAYEPDGVHIFDNAKEAAAHYGLPLPTLYALINSGEESSAGVSFDYQLTNQ